jgi:hypothetical protein
MDNVQKHDSFKSEPFKIYFHVGMRFHPQLDFYFIPKFVMYVSVTYLRTSVENSTHLNPSPGETAR